MKLLLWTSRVWSPGEPWETILKEIKQKLKSCSTWGMKVLKNLSSHSHSLCDGCIHRVFTPWHLTVPSLAAKPDSLPVIALWWEPYGWQCLGRQMPRGYVGASTASAMFDLFFFLLQDVMQYYLILELYVSEGTFIAYLNKNKVKVRLSRMWVFRCCAPFFPGCNEESEMMGAIWWMFITEEASKGKLQSKYQALLEEINKNAEKLCGKPLGA